MLDIFLRRACSTPLGCWAISRTVSEQDDAGVQVSMVVWWVIGRFFSVYEDGNIGNLCQSNSIEGRVLTLHMAELGLTLGTHGPTSPSRSDP